MQNMIRRLKIFILCLMIAVMAVHVPAATAQRSAQVIIRDAEIEGTLKEWLSPLLKSAGLGPNSINLIIVQSPQINAFVAGGANIFIYTGLIQKSDNPEEVIGVLAHELGHITGGHLINFRGAIERASYESILGMVLGIGAAVLTGNGEAASAVIAGSQSMATRRLLAHSRVNESSADQAALRFMESAEINPTGLKTFFGKLESQELLPASQQSEYMRTHPITRDRVAALATKIGESPYKDQPSPARWAEQHARMKAKLLGFIDPGRVPWTYSDRDTSIAAQYARTIAYYRENKVDQAIEAMDKLIAQEPENPYFQELKGQMLVDFGRVAEGVPYYRNAVLGAPDSGLIRIDLGQALLESNQGDEAIKEAITELERAIKEEPRASRAYRFLATAYGRLGQDAVAKLYLAEEAVLQRNLPYARRQVEAALTNLPDGSPEEIRANDLLEHIKVLEAEEKRAGRR